MKTKNCCKVGEARQKAEEELAEQYKQLFIATIKINALKAMLSLQEKANKKLRMKIKSTRKIR